MEIRFRNFYKCKTFFHSQIYYKNYKLKHVVANKKILFARIKKFFDNLEIKKKLIEVEKKSILLAASVAASHHINQPLMLISGNVELLKIKIEKLNLDNFSELDQHISKIISALHRVTKIAEKMKNVKDVKLTKYAGGVDMVDLK